MAVQPLEIRLGLPKGRYNSPDRFNTKLFLEAAGFIFEGYEPKGEEERPICLSDPEIKPVLIRHEDGPFALVSAHYLPSSFRADFKEEFREELHLAIFGEDWHMEWAHSSLMNWFGERLVIPKLAELHYGRNKVVAAISSSDFDALTIMDEKTLEGLFRYSNLTGTSFICVTKYVNIAAHAIAEALLNERNRHFLAVGKPLDTNTIESAIEKFVVVQGKSIKPAKICPLAYIIERQGETESYVAKGMANVVVENVGTGRTLQANGLHVVSTLVESSAASLYGHFLEPWKGGSDRYHWTAAYVKEKETLVDGEELVATTTNFLNRRVEKLNHIIGTIRRTVKEMEDVAYCVVYNPGRADGLDELLGNFVAEQRRKEAGLNPGSPSAKPIAAFLRLMTAANDNSTEAIHAMVYGNSAKQKLEHLVRQTNPSAEFHAYTFSEVSGMSGLWKDGDGKPWHQSRYPFFSSLFFEKDVLA